MDLRFLVSLTLLLGLFFVNANIAAGQVGVCYGGFGNNLPSPAETVELFKQKNIRRVRTYNADHNVLTALRGSDIEVMLGLENPALMDVATSQSKANKWVQDNVISYVGDVKFRYVSVGNEVHISDSYAQFLVPAMENIDRALSGAGLGHIKVSTAIDMTVLEKSYPPSQGSFRGEVMVLMEPIIRFLVNKKSPLHLNLYTYFAYAGNPKIGLDYALFKASPGTGVQDPPRSYDNLFDAMLDAVYSALEQSDGESLEVVISETGWPTAGGGTETNVGNAEIYNNNLINHVKKGTPKRPGKEIETYLFAMYDENMKVSPPGAPDVEKFWGLFHPNKEAKYNVNFG